MWVVLYFGLAVQTSNEPTKKVSLFETDFDAIKARLLKEK
jgi:hypothetical protein